MNEVKKVKEVLEDIAPDKLEKREITANDSES